MSTSCLSLRKFRMWCYSLLHRSESFYSCLDDEDIEEWSQPGLSSESLFRGSWNAPGEYDDLGRDANLESSDDCAAASCEPIDHATFYPSLSERKYSHSLLEASREKLMTSKFVPMFTLKEESMEFRVDEWIDLNVTENESDKQYYMSSFETEEETASYTSSLSSDHKDTSSNIDSAAEHSSSSRSIRWSDEIEGQELETIHTVPLCERASTNCPLRPVRCRIEI